MSRRLMDDEAVKSESTHTLDMMLTKLIWDRALRSDDDKVMLAIKHLWQTLHEAEKK